MAEFRFTPKQQEVVDYVLEQLKLGAEGKNILVSGRGGVGKTSMVCHLVTILLRKGYRVACGAMTGKATGVLRQKIFDCLKEEGLTEEDYKYQLCIETISKITRKAKPVGMDENGETIYSNVWVDPKRFDYDVLIIDELSMVPHYIQLWWNQTNCRVIGLGDYCQIPEVHTGDTQKEVVSFRHDLKLPPSKLVNGYGIKVLKDLPTFELDQVLRSTGDITLLCNELRDFKKSKEDTIKVIKKWSDKSDDIFYTKDISQLETGNDWQIIAYTNRMCQAINDKLAIGKTFPNVRDKIILHDNLNPLGAYNGEVYVFGDLIKRIEEFNNRGGDNITVIWKFNGEMPKKNSSDPIEKQCYMDYNRYRMQAAEKHHKRLEEIPKIIRNAKFLTNEQKEEYIESFKDIKKTFQNEEQCFNHIIQRLEEVDLDLMREIVKNATTLPKIFFVTIGFGYCCTTHKSQGSEYEKVCYILEKMDRPLLYTGCSRAKKKLKVIDLT